MKNYKITVLVFLFALPFNLAGQIKYEREYNLGKEKIPGIAKTFIESCCPNSKVKWYGEESLKGLYSIVRKYDLFRLGHRISTEQTIRNNNPVQFRLRYRIGVEKALNGKDVDPEEFYLKLNNEYLFAAESRETDLEIRLMPALGYAFNDNNKFEFGIDYRVNKIKSGNSRNQFWLYMGWFISM